MNEKSSSRSIRIFMGFIGFVKFCRVRFKDKNNATMQLYLELPNECSLFE